MHPPGELVPDSMGSVMSLMGAVGLELVPLGSTLMEYACSTP